MSAWSAMKLVRNAEAIAIAEMPVLDVASFRRAII